MYIVEAVLSSLTIRHKTNTVLVTARRQVPLPQAQARARGGDTYEFTRLVAI